jgi:hypothetical protein
VATPGGIQISYDSPSAVPAFAVERFKARMRGPRLVIGLARLIIACYVGRTQIDLMRTGVAASERIVR